MSKDRKYGWHFLPASKKLEYLDGRDVRVGETLEMRATNNYYSGTEPILCSQGMHASAKIADAANYCRGPVLCRVLVSGELKVGSDKFVGRYRRVLWMRKVPKELAKRWARQVGAKISREQEKDSAEYILYLGFAADDTAMTKLVRQWARDNGCPESR